MAETVFLNGRFLSQPMTGVQRFSAEIARAIDELATRGEWPETVLLTPSRIDEPIAAYRRLRLREVGRMRGHLWEQAELPAAARGGVLVNLGNTAPILTGRRQVVVIHDAGVFDTPESYSLRFRTWYKTLQHWLVRAGAQVATVSDFSRRRIVAHLGLDPTQIAVIYEGAEHVLRTQADTTILSRHGLQPQNFAVVVSSRVMHKNLAALGVAAEALAQRGMVIAIAGGTNRDVFHDLPGVGFAERRLGRVSEAELRALYENAACLLFPSRYEGFGLPPVEAMACGCPVLAARGSAVEEVCSDNALYFDAGDSRSMVDAVTRLLDEPGLAGDLHRRGRQHAAKLTWAAAARALGGVVQRLH